MMRLEVIDLDIQPPTLTPDQLEAQQRLDDADRMALALALPTYRCRGGRLQHMGYQCPHAQCHSSEPGQSCLQPSEAMLSTLQAITPEPVADQARALSDDAATVMRLYAQGHRLVNHKGPYRPFELVSEADIDELGGAGRGPYPWALVFELTGRRLVQITPDDQLQLTPMGRAVAAYCLEYGLGHAS